MENKETKSSMKSIKNRITLHNLSKKQKEVLMKTGIIGSGLGTGLFMLYSMKDPETIPGLSTDSTPVNDLTESSNGELNNSVEIMSLTPVTEISEQNISFGEAFKVARELCGPGGWFIWKGDTYNTYYKEEWQALSLTERNDYLASIEITIVQSREDQNFTNVQTDESYKEIFASSADIKDDNVSVINIQEKEFSIDSNAYNDQATTLDHQNLSIENNDLVTGEIITLDDDTDIIENGYFELGDDFEIISISEEESSLIDNLTFDSSEVTAFPWETSEVAAENEILTNEIENVSVDLIEDSIEQIDDKESNLNDEYPWGEPISKTTVNEAETQVLEEIQLDDTANIISNPEEIKEYPWGETMENSVQNTEINNTETIIQEVDEKTVQNQSVTLHEIEEYPWGEKIEVNERTSNAQVIINENEVINLKEENIGVILPEESETVSLSKLPPSFDEITEFPWGETVPHSQVDPYISPENDLFDNPTN